MPLRRQFHRIAAIALLAPTFWLSAAQAQNPAPRVTLETNQGRIVLQLDAQKAPQTVANFLQYVRDGHYSGTVFHRVIPDFMIQGGGFSADMQQKPTRAPIALESRNGLNNVRGSIAMARTNDPHSATAQFFINLRDNPFLNQARSPDGHGYTVFGRVVSGMDVIDRIAATPTSRQGMHANVPTQAITIHKATLEH